VKNSKQNLPVDATTHAIPDPVRAPPSFALGFATVIRRHISTMARRESMTIIIRNAFSSRRARVSERFDFRIRHRAFTRKYH
jgi:hypothetical protein